MPLKSMIISSVSQSKRLVATLVTRPGRNEIVISNFKQNDSVLANKIEFHSGEKVIEIEWLQINGVSNGKKRGSKSKDSETFNEYLAILLDSGIILIYSPLTKDYINKITNDLPLTSITSVEGKKYDLITFEPNFGLKFFSSVNPQLIDSLNLKDIGDISYIQSIPKNKYKYSLLLANDSSIFLLDESYEVKLTLQLPLNCDSPKKVIFNDEDKLVFTDNSKSFYMFDLSKSELAMTIKTFSSNSPILDIDQILNDLLYIITEDGSIELFNLKNEESNKWATKLNIQGGDKVGKFTKLVPTDESLQIFKGVWYDSFNVNITDFEFEDLTKLNGEIPISVVETVDDVNGDDIEMATNDAEAKELINSDSINDDDLDNKVSLDERHKCDELDPLRDLLQPFIKNRLSDTQNSNIDDLISILVQNSQFTKPYIHLLTTNETVLFFSNVSQCISNYIGLGSLQNDNEIKSKLREWFHWTLLLRGSVLVQDSNCVEWLKLIQCGLNQDVKLIPQMLKLEGKLELLKDQLELRRGIGSRQVNGLSALQDPTTEDSLVFEGEGGFEDEDLDDAEEEIDEIDDDEE